MIALNSGDSISFFKDRIMLYRYKAGICTKEFQLYIVDNGNVRIVSNIRMAKTHIPSMELLVVHNDMRGGNHSAIFWDLVTTGRFSIFRMSDAELLLAVSEFI